MQLTFTLFILLSLRAGLSVIAATADAWRTRSIYQIVTDRFAPSNNDLPGCDTTARKYCGGTWQGIIQHLEYIQNMGFDAVWISPVVANIDGETRHGEAYHGYWTKDINSLNKHFGSEDDLNQLSLALHSRGMFLMLDVVVNHMGPNTSSSISFDSSGSNPYSIYTPFFSPESYHKFNLISPSSYLALSLNQTDIEQSWLGDSLAPLPNLNTEDSQVVEVMNDWIENLVIKYGVDGLRIDTVKHVRRDFWRDFSTKAGVFTMGEVLSDNVTYVAQYTDVLDSVLDYPSYFTLFDAFSSAGTGNLSALIETVTASQGAFKHGTIAIGSFLENHDQVRFQAKTKDIALVMNAMAWPFIHDGIPILYYGQEQGYTGAGDPDNREALWLFGYQTSDKPLVKHVTSLNAARRVAIAANQGYLTKPMSFLDQPGQINTTLAVYKPPLVTLLTNAGSTANVTWTIPNNIFKPEEAILDVLTCSSVNFGRTTGGDLVVSAKAGLPQVLIAASTLTPLASKFHLCESSVGGSSNGGERGARSLVFLLVPLMITGVLEVIRA